MKILVSGIHGFVGRGLAKAFAELEDIEVCGLSRSTDPVEGVSKIFTWNDLYADSVPDNFDSVMHLAGIAHDTKGQEHADEYRRVNVGLTEKLYTYFAGSRARKFIFFSSIKAVADSSAKPLTETETPHPIGLYGCSKLMAEQHIMSGPLPDKEVYILRPAMIFGPGAKGNLPLLCAFVRRGLPWPLGAWHSSHSFVSIDNVCYVLREILTGKVPDGIYNLSDDSPISVNELVSMISRQTGRKARIWRVPRPLVKTMAALAAILHLPYDSSRLHKITEPYIVSNAKIRAALGIDRLPVDTTTALEHTIKTLVRAR